ncbi:MAG: TIGR02569 family protein [Actinomycetales bacterium]|nr:TIGR02569 family protein [Actinomycetales bacterium]
MGTVVGVNDATLPEHVRSAFGATDGRAVPVVAGSGTGWLVSTPGGPVVLRPVADTAQANWSARVREKLDVTGLRVAPPVRSRDGRHVVSGWRADRAVPGRPEARADETIAWSFRINTALAGVEKPRVVRRPSSRPWGESDLFGFAEAAAWDGDPERDLAPGMEDRGTPFATHRAAALLGATGLIRHRRPVEIAAPGLVHGDLARGLLFDATAEPALTDIVPYERPASWSAALVAVDHLSWGTVDVGVLLRWAHLEEWAQMVLRAAVFRLAVHALHPGSRPAAMDGLQAMARQVGEFVGDTD